MAPTLRKKARISYYEPDEPNLDEYVFCVECADYVYEYCSIHGPLLVVPDDKVPAAAPRVPRAALTVPRAVLHLARSRIPGAGIGVFSTLTLPVGVRFGPYRGARRPEAASRYCWQIYAADRKPSHVVDAADDERSNWMRYVNCSRHCAEQNLLAYQYRGEIYYRTIKIVPRFTELLVFYGTQFARELGVDVRRYNAPRGAMGAVPKTTALQQIGLNEKFMQHPSSDNTEVAQNDVTIQPTAHKTTINGTETSECHLSSNSIKISQEVESARLKTCPSLNIQKSNNTGVTTYKHKVCDEYISNNNVSSFQDRLIHTGRCDKSLSKSGDFDRQKGTHTGVKPYKCDVCDKSFIQSSDLDRHKRTHTGEKPYKCDVCDKSFIQSSDLDRHKRTHTGEKPYKCDVCDKSFIQSSDLDRHKRTHTGEKPYKCDVCDKSFADSGNLNSHKRTHTGEKPYKCDVCDKSFAQSGHLDKHKRTHTGEKPYKCDVCDKSFAQSGHLDKHKRTHTGEKPYKCDVCDKSFAQSGHLDKHKRTHTGEKPYKCDVCDKSFAQSGDLNKHKRIHTGEKPYKCDVCDKSFTDSSSLRVHKRRHTFS